MVEHPDSALSLLKSISSPQDMSEADGAYYALLMAAATDKNDSSLLPCDSLLDFALHYYDDDDKEKAVALLYKGRLQAEMGDVEVAMEHNLKALEVLQNYPEDLQYRRLIYSALAPLYRKSKLYDEALDALRQSLSYALTSKDSAIAYSSISSIYHVRDLKDSAISYQQRALEYASLLGDSSLIVRFWHNLSVFHYYFDESDSAMFYARKIIQDVSPKNESYADYYCNIGDLYLYLAEYDSARYYLRESLSLSEKTPWAYWSLSSLEADLGNFKEAYQYLTKYTLMVDSLYYSKQMTEMQRLVFRHQTEMKVKDEQIKFNRLIRIIVSIFILLAFLVVLFYQQRINSRKRLQEQFRQKLEYTNEKLCLMQQRIEENESVIVFLQNEQNKNVEEVAKREVLIEQLKKEKVRLRTWLFEQTPIYEKVIALSKQKVSDKKERKVLTVAEYKKLKEIVFDIYAEYISILRMNHSRLTDDDLLYLCLQQVGLHPLTIAMCFGFSDTIAINQRKSRIKAKML